MKPGVVNVRGLTPSIAQLFRTMADIRGLSQAEYLTLLVTDDARLRVKVLEAVMDMRAEA